MKTVVQLSNRRLTEPGGRVEKFQTRKRLLADHGWIVVICYSPATLLGILPAIIRCILIVHRENADVILSSSSPWHLHVVGLSASLLTGRPWVAEFRDPLVTIPTVDRRTFSWYGRRLMESIVVRFADKIVWLDGIQIPENYFKDKYPGLPEDKVIKLPYLGFDESRFGDVDPVEWDAFTLTYAGSFYEGWLEPYAFLEGLGKLVASEDLDPGDIQAHFYGDWTDEYNRAAAEFGVSAHVQHHGFVPHEEIVPILKGSDVVVHIGGDDPRNHLSVPSKIWDYLGARTPILVITDPSFSVAEFIEDLSLGLVAPPSDPVAIGEAISELRSGHFQYAPDPNVFDKYTRRHNISALTTVLDNTLEKH